jgi:adenosylcobinamide-GDP ribazoletransferase
MPPLMHLLPNARPNGLSAGVGKPSLWSVGVGLSLSLSCASLLLGGTLVPFLTMIVTLAVIGFMALLASRKLGGQTGDILGATQQLCEVALLLTFSALQT